MKYNPQKHHRKSIRLKGYDYSQAGLYFVTICTQNRACLFGHISNGKMKLNDAGKMDEYWYFELGKKFNDIKCHEMVVMPNHIHFIVEIIGADLRVCPNEPITPITPVTPVTPVQTGKTGKTGQTGEHAGADLRVCPNKRGEPNGTEKRGEHVGADLRVCPNERGEPNGTEKRGEHAGADPRVCPNKRGEPNGTEKRGEHAGADLRVCPNERGEPNGTEKRGEHAGSPLPTIVQWFKTMTTNEYIRGVKNFGWKRFNGKLWQRNYWEHIVRNENEYQRISQYIINNPQKWVNDKFNNGDGHILMEKQSPYKDEPWMI